MDDDILDDFDDEIEDDTSQIMIQMFGVRELEPEVRTEFQLPCDPYSLDEEDVKKVQKYLQALGIVYYRSHVYPEGVLVEREGLDLLEDQGWKAFRFSCILDTATFEPKSWTPPLDHEREKRRVQREYAEKHGDDRSWFRWNEPTLIKSLTESRVTCS